MDVRPEEDQAAGEPSEARLRRLDAELAGVEARSPSEQGLWAQIKGWVRLEDSFNQRYNLGCRLREAVHRCGEAGDPGAGAPPMPERKRQEIVAHLSHAIALFRKGSGELETILRELFIAERELIPYLPAGRGAAAIADVRSEISVAVPEAHRAGLFAALDEATERQRKTPSDAGWRDHLFAAKAQADEIVIESYRSRERLRDGILLLGGELMILLVLILLSGLLAQQSAPLATPAITGVVPMPGWFVVGVQGGATALTSAGALWLGFLFGAMGACLSGLYSFTVNRSAPGEYETAAATAIRPLIGGASGLIAAALFSSGLLAETTNPVPMLILVCFVFGFSERIVMGAVENIGSRVSLGTAPPTVSGPVPKTKPDAG